MNKKNTKVIATFVLLILLSPLISMSSAESYSDSSTHHWQNDCGPTISAQNSWDSTGNWHDGQWLTADHPLNYTKIEIVNNKLMRFQNPSSSTITPDEIKHIFLCEGGITLRLGSGSSVIEWDFVATSTTLGPLSLGDGPGPDQGVDSWWIEGITQYQDEVSYGTLFFPRNPQDNFRALIEVENRVQIQLLESNSGDVNVIVYDACKTTSACEIAGTTPYTAPSAFEDWYYSPMALNTNLSLNVFKLLRVHVVDLGTQTTSNQNPVGTAMIESILASTSLWYRHQLGITVEWTRYTSYQDILSTQPYSIIDSINGFTKTNYGFRGAICEDDNYPAQLTQTLHSFETDIIEHYGLIYDELTEDVDLVMFISGDNLVKNSAGNNLQGCSTPALRANGVLVNEQHPSFRQVNGRFIFVQTSRTGNSPSWSQSYPIFESAITLSHEIGHSLGGPGHPYSRFGFPFSSIITNSITLGYCYNPINCLPRDIMEKSNPIGAFNPVYFFPSWQSKINDGPTQNNAFITGTHWLNYTRIELNPIFKATQWMPGGYYIENWWVNIQRQDPNPTSVNYLPYGLLSIRGLNEVDHLPNQLVTINSHMLGFSAPISVWSRDTSQSCSWDSISCNELWNYINSNWPTYEDSTDTLGCQSPSSTQSYCIGSFVIQHRKITDEKYGPVVNGVSYVGSYELNSMTPEPELYFVMSGHTGTYPDNQYIFHNSATPCNLGNFQLMCQTPSDWSILE